MATQEETILPSNLSFQKVYYTVRKVKIYWTRRENKY